MFFSDTEGSSVVSFEVKSEFIRSEGTVWEGMMSEHILFKHKLTSKLLDRVMYSSTGESKTLLSILCLEGNKDDSFVIATEGVISATEGNKDPAEDAAENTGTDNAGKDNAGKDNEHNHQTGGKAPEDLPS